MQSTLPKKYWSPSWSTIQLQSSSSRREDRWFTRGARERKGSRVRENKFLGWVVGWQAEHMQKMETENWCRNCKFSGDNSSTEEGIFLVHPSFLPLETSILLVFLRGSRLPPRQQDFFPPLVPTGEGKEDGCISRFSPRQAFVSAVFLGALWKAIALFAFRLFAKQAPVKIFGWNPRRINRRPAALFRNIE